MKKVVLAFSGGLDTSYCAKYLSDELGYEVHAVTVNTGGFSESEIISLEKKSSELGVASYKCFDETTNFYDECIKYLIFGNVLKNNTYPLSVSAERVFQAITIAKYALSKNVDAIAHGSTGAGNDQIRFDSIFQTVIPGIEIITPIRDLNLSREEEIDYLKKKGLDIDQSKSIYSVNKGLWGTSIGGKETLTSHEYLPENAFPFLVDDSLSPLKIEIEFDKGEPVKMNGIDEEPVKVIEKLNDLGSIYGIGRDIHVGDTIIGIKGRVGFEAPAAILLVKAHHLLEKHTLSKHQLGLKDQISLNYGNMVHEGLFLDPVIEDIHSFLKSSQKRVSGKVFATIFPHRFILEGIESRYDLMMVSGGKYGEENTAWTGADAKGFAKIYSNSGRIFNSASDEK
jgi:argininosuccinate synthase